MFFRLLPAALVALLGLVLAASPSAQVTFSGLGDLDGGVVSSEARAVSADGSVVVGSSASAEGTQAFRWADGQMAVVGSNASSVAFDVNADGSVIVGRARYGSRNLAFRWDGGSNEALGSLSGSSGSSSAQAVSADGSVVFGFTQSPRGLEAFRWDGQMVGLGDLDGAAFNSIVHATTPLGVLGVGRGVGTAGRLATKFTTASVVPLPDLEGGPPDATALGVNATGSVIVGYGFSADGRRAIRWVNDVAEEIVGPTGTTESTAYAVSADGTMVVGSVTTAEGPQAFVWTLDDGMRLLKSILLDAGATAVADWALTTAFDLSADGRTIVGAGVNPNGDSEGWRVSSGLVVNDDRDLADLDDTDGLCDAASEAGLQCTLRAALQEANAQGGASISFDIPSQGIPVITPTTALPTITTPTEIDATTQPGGVVHLLGASAGNVDGLHTSGTNDVVVRGFAVTGFEGWGIHLSGGSGHVVAGSAIGFLPGTNGDIAANGRGGVLVSADAMGAEIGGEDEADANRIYGGVDVVGSGTRGVEVWANEMAVDARTAGIGNAVVDLAGAGPTCAAWKRSGMGPNGGMPAPRLLSIEPTLVKGQTQSGARVVVYKTAGTILGVGGGRGRYWPAWVLPVGVGEADADGAFSIALDQTLAAGDHVTATATDTDGNTSELSQLKRPVIFLPGIGGSWLEAEGDGANLWLPTPPYNDQLARLSMLETGQSLEPVAQDGILEGTSLLPYTDVLNAITAAGYPGDIGNDNRLTNDLWRFPFDWRLNTLDVADDLKALVDEITGGGTDVAVSCEVDLVAHSMGGIVSNDYVRIEEEHARDHVHRYLTVATPYLGASQAAAAHSIGYVFEAEASLPLFTVDWGRMLSMARNIPAIYGLLPSRAYWQAANTASPSHSHGFLFQNLDGHPLRSYEATVAFLAADKTDANGQPLGLGRTSSMIQDQQTDVHDRIDDWSEWSGPPQVFRLAGSLPGITTTGWKLGVNMVEPFGLDLPPNSTPREEMGDTDRHRGWRAMIRPILGVGDQTVPLVSATLGLPSTGVGAHDFSGVDSPWIEPFGLFPCTHTGILESDCTNPLGVTALSQVRHVLRSGYQLEPAPQARRAVRDAPIGAEALYVSASGPVTVTIEDAEGRRTGPTSQDAYREIAYEVPGVGYWPGEYGVTVSVPRGAAYTLTVNAPTEPITTRVYRMRIGVLDETRTSALFPDQPLASRGGLQLVLAADGTPETAALVLDADGDGSFEGTLAPVAVLTGTVGYPAVPIPDPAVVRAQATGDAPVTIDLELPDVGAEGWTWVLSESIEWVTPGAISGAVPATVPLTLAADRLPDGLTTASMTLTLHYETYTLDVVVPVEVFVGESAVASEPTAALDPDTVALSAAFPNPALGTARLRLTLGTSQTVSVVVYDALGRQAAVLHDGPLSAGTHPFELATADLSPGVYVLRARTDAGTTSSRLTVAR